MAADESKAEATWFAGGINRTQSKSMLAGCPDHTFLVRKSSQAGCYSIDVVISGGYLAVLVLPGKEGGVICSAVPLLGVREQAFSTLADLVAASGDWLKTPCPALAGSAAARGSATRGVAAEGEEEDSILMLSGAGGAAGRPKPRREGEEEDSLLMAGAGEVDPVFDPRAGRVSRGIGTRLGGTAQREGEEEDSMLMAGISGMPGGGMGTRREGEEEDSMLMAGMGGADDVFDTRGMPSC